MPTIHLDAWDFNRLLSVKGHREVTALHKVVLAIADHRIFMEGLVDINGSTRSHFKDVSNQGAVWHRKKHWDLGNWSYTVLFQWIARVVQSRPKSAPVLAQLQELWQTYESLQPKAARTTLSCSMKGDVIEACLAPCRLTGSAVDRLVVQERVAFNQLFVCYSKHLEEVKRICFGNDSGPPTLEQCPDPDRFVKAVLWAQRLMAPSSTADITTEDCKQQFTVACELAKESTRNRDLWYSN